MSDNNANPHIPEIQNIDEEWNISPLADEQVNALYQLNFLLEVTASRFKIPRETRARIVSSYAVFMVSELEEESRGDEIQRERAESYQKNKVVFLDSYKQIGLMHTLTSYHEFAAELEEEENLRVANQFKERIVQGLREQGLEVEGTIQKASDFLKDNSGFQN